MSCCPAGCECERCIESLRKLGKLLGPEGRKTFRELHENEFSDKARRIAAKTGMPQVEWREL